MRPWLDFALAQAPALQRRLLRGRAGQAERLTFLELIRRGDAVFDVGANVGQHTALFSHLVGRRGRVHAFEPVPPTFAALAARMALRPRLGNVVLNECALAAGDGGVRLFVPGTDYGQASLVRHTEGSWAGPGEVRCYASRSTTLDGYLRARGETPPAFVKCDVEGAELRVLEGAVDTMRRRAPLLHLEVNSDWTRSHGYEPADLVDFLAPFGYSSFYLVSDAPRSLREPLPELAAFHGSANLVCAVPELHEERLAGLAAAAARAAALRR